MERKIIFLDIDGVLQPIGSQKRFRHVHNPHGENDMPRLYELLEYDFNIDYREHHRYDVAAVFFDWDKESIALLKLTLNLTGAMFVLSSDWRLTDLQPNGDWGDGYGRMKDFFTIYGLEKYYIDNTECNYIDKAFIEEANAKYDGKEGETLPSRTIEILEWLSRNPDVEKWVAIDDMRLTGLDGHFVNTKRRYKWRDAEKAIKILNDCF